MLQLGVSSVAIYDFRSFRALKTPQTYCGDNDAMDTKVKSLRSTPGLTKHYVNYTSSKKINEWS